MFVCLFKRTKKKLKKKNLCEVSELLAVYWLFIIYKKFPEKPFEK